MRKPLILAALMIAAVPALAALPPLAQSRLDAILVSQARTPANMARDKYRHPAETLAFFGVRPTDTVVEIWPGGGWWTEILTPYLAEHGRLIVAAPAGKPSDAIAAKMAARPEMYPRVARANFPTRLGGVKVPDGIADKVLTFRNVHNWRGGYMTPDKADYSAEAFRELYAMLKPGGVLGIEDHRLPEDMDSARERTSGYIKVSTVRALAEAAGFKFAGASNVNANPRDTHAWPKGVWTLPPTYAEGDTDRAKYAAIGESDRMTLKFIRPR